MIDSPIKVFFEANELFAKAMGRGVTLYSIAVFLKVCIKDGVPMKELEKDLGLYSATISNIIRKLSLYKEKGEIQGADLVYTTSDIENRRRFAVYLTDKGRDLRESCIKILEKRGLN